MPEIFLNLLLIAPPLVIAVVLHEVAHGWAAYKLGDPTAKLLGRLSLNPIRHIDPFMTLIVPGILILSGSPFIFGGAKPVPVNPLNCRNPRMAMVWIAAAGPITNVGLALGFAGLFHVLLPFADTLLGGLMIWWCSGSVVINLVLAFFNMLPVPPLDGGRIAVGLLPQRLSVWLARLEPFGILIALAVIMSGLPIFEVPLKLAVSLLARG